MDKQHPLDFSAEAAADIRLIASVARRFRLHHPQPEDPAIPQGLAGRARRYDPDGASAALPGRRAPARPSDSSRRHEETRS